MMTPSTILGRCALVSAAAALALMIALAPASAQDESAAAELLPAPDQKPISRVVRTGESAIESPTPPETTTDTTFAAVPTTPILSNDLPSGTADEPFGAESSEESVIPDRPIGADSAGGTTASNEPLVPATADRPATDAAEATDAAPPAAAPESTAAAEPAEATDPAAGTGETASVSEESSDDSVTVEQTAAVAPIEGMIRILYASEASTVTDPAKEVLAPLVAKLNEDYSLRVKVLAYAEGDEDQSTHARGVALARALAMREYLTEQGIATDRMDLRALGNTAQEEPADRVDLIAVSE